MDVYITDSFHGVAFCLIYKKNFVVITVDNGRNSRMKDLMDKVGLSDRFFHGSDNIDFGMLLNTPIDYVSVYKNLGRESSWEFLRKNLNSVR